MVIKYIMEYDSSPKKVLSYFFRNFLNFKFISESYIIFAV